MAGETLRKRVIGFDSLVALVSIPTILKTKCYAYVMAPESGRDPYMASSNSVM
jgi:hypothetical protein